MLIKFNKLLFSFKADKQTRFERLWVKYAFYHCVHKLGFVDLAPIYIEAERKRVFSDKLPVRSAVAFSEWMDYVEFCKNVCEKIRKLALQPEVLLPMFDIGAGDSGFIRLYPALHAPLCGLV